MLNKELRRSGAAVGRLGVDIGGTFTDFVWIDEHGELLVHKELSTPKDPAIAVIDGINRLKVPESAPVIHGSTVSTNVLLEKRGSRTALICTEGFADILAIGRQDRPELYALVANKSEPLVPKKWRLEVRERITAIGNVLTPLSMNDLEKIIERIFDSNIESVAVSLLYSFLQPEHEQAIRKAIRDYETRRKDGMNLLRSAPLHISLSSEILPEFREYERTTATVINAYVSPIMSKYLERLDHELAPRNLKIMQSNGGLLTPYRAGQLASRTVLSGPAGGVVGARYIAEHAGYQRIITFDMGGTSTDVALCPAKLPTTTEGEIAELPLRLPMIDIHTVGAGGGSLAHLDAGGALRVGPKSAGADPGPVCYGRYLGEINLGDRVTTTDANLILGRLVPEGFLDGSMLLDEEAARQALVALAETMSASSPEEAAWGIIEVANANMYRALRRISVERGYDPRDFTLVAFGGAGGLHACELADRLHIHEVLIPSLPGVLSALGMLVAQPMLDFSQTVMRQLPGGLWSKRDWLEDLFVSLEKKALTEMIKEGYSSELLQIDRQLDLRYEGQSHELTVTLPREKRGLDIALLFHEAHRQRYTYHRPHIPVEIVNIRCLVKANTELPNFPFQQATGSSLKTAIIRKSQVWFASGYEIANIIDRRLLEPGHSFDGPAVIFQYDSTTLVPPSWHTIIDPIGNLILTKNFGIS